MELHFTDSGFYEDVLKSESPVLVDFYADWCGPCKMMGPIIEQLAEEFEGKVRVGKLNIDTNPETAEKYSVMNIPTMILFKNGTPVEKFVGVVSKSKLEDVLKNA